jgi:hypothetical protein
MADQRRGVPANKRDSSRYSNKVIISRGDTTVLGHATDAVLGHGDRDPASSFAGPSSLTFLAGRAEVCLRAGRKAASDGCGGEGAVLRFGIGGEGRGRGGGREWVRKERG